MTVARARLADLEGRWSRFRPTSEISRLNGAGGRPTRVSPETMTLIARARDGYDLTAGRFDPFQLTALEAIGYRTSFEAVDHPVVAPAAVVPAAVVPAAVGADPRVELDTERREVTLARGVGFDPGGIGKGMAADLVVEELLILGVAGVCVNVGGDLRVAGTPPAGDAWIVDVRDREDDAPIARLAIEAGAVATTSRSRRRWVAADGTEHHHVLDPSTGTSAATPVIHATAIAAQGWQAEVLSKVAFLDRVDGISLAERLGATAMVATEHGVVSGPGWARYARTMEMAA